MCVYCHDNEGTCTHSMTTPGSAMCVIQTGIQLPGSSCLLLLLLHLQRHNVTLGPHTPHRLGAGVFPNTKCVCVCVGWWWGCFVLSVKIFFFLINLVGYKQQDL